MQPPDGPLDEPFDVVVVGSLNLDLVVRTPRHPAPGETLSGTSYAEIPGGKGLNQAVAAARSGARVALVGAVGSDAVGQHLRALVRTECIDDSWLRTIDGAVTGRALITVDDRGENSIIVIAGANGALTIGDIPPGRVVLAQLETTTEAVARAFAIASGQGATTILNPAPAAPLPDELLGLCRVLVPNEHEVELLGGRATIVDRVEHLVVTRGAAGADHLTAGDESHIDAFPVEPVDTTGAGDAFCGALACRLALGDEMADALRFAAAAGALATTTPGAVPSQPSRADTLALLSGRPGQ